MTGTSHKQTRAGRLKLIAKLQLGRHSAHLLHSKEEALQREQKRLRAHVQRTQTRWENSCAEARRWLLRSRALGASSELRSLVAEGPESATVVASWQSSMGIKYPGVVDCTPGATPALTSTSALRPTLDSYGVALGAAADHASTTGALTRLDAELAKTRRRRRAIEERLVPRLEHELGVLDLHLDEQDREQALRVQLARSQHQPRGRQ